MDLKEARELANPVVVEASDAVVSICAHADRGYADQIEKLGA